jgi:hypothetical protein
MQRAIWSCVAAFCFLANQAAAHGPGEEPEKGMPGVMDCEHPPADALKAVPDDLRDWLALDCAFNGVSLMPTADWSWRYTGSFFDRPMVFAGLAEVIDKRNDGPWYFKRIERVRLSEETRQALHEKLAKEIPMYKEYVQKVHAIVQINTVNNYDDSITFNMAFDANGHVMGVPCTATCRPEHAFYMERRK